MDAVLVGRSGLEHDEVRAQAGELGLDGFLRALAHREHRDDERLAQDGLALEGEEQHQRRQQRAQLLAPDIKPTFTSADLLAAGGVEPDCAVGSATERRNAESDWRFRSA